MTHLDHDDLVCRLERLAAMRPTPEATRHALERTRRALGESVVLARPSTTRTAIKRLAFAAAVLLIASGMFYWLWPSPAPALANFAEVQAAANAVHSVTCRQVIRIEGKPEEVTQLFLLETGLARAEEMDGSFTITDFRKKRAIAINPKKREASLVLGMNLPKINLYQTIKNLPSDASARRLAGKKLDGRDVLGFVVKVMDEELTVWADTKTRLPMRIEAKGQEDGKATELVMDEFLYDKELDPKLFSFEPPPGYKLRTSGIEELPAAPTDLKLRDLVVTPLTGIGPAKFGMPQDEVEKLLGKPDAVQAMGTNGYVQLNYGSRGLFLDVSKTQGLVIIHCVSQKTFATRVRDFSGKTDKGIALGARLVDIVKAYGEPDRKEADKGTTHVSYYKLNASFVVFGDKLVGMMFTRKRPAE
jgi:hypothetical protein